MFEELSSFVQAVLNNPLLIAAVFAIIRNLGGYIYNCIEAHKLLPYSASQFLVTLGLWETVFLILQGGANMAPATTAAIAIVLDFIRSLKTAITNAAKTLTSTAK